MNAYFFERVAELRQSPVDHLLGRLIQTETEDGKLTDEELLSFCRLLLIAGNETTTGLITASVRIFDEFPETVMQLREHPNWCRRLLKKPCVITAIRSHGSKNHLRRKCCWNRY